MLSYEILITFSTIHQEKIIKILLSNKTFFVLVYSFIQEYILRVAFCDKRKFKQLHMA